MWHGTAPIKAKDRGRQDTGRGEKEGKEERTAEKDSGERAMGCSEVKEGKVEDTRGCVGVAEREGTRRRSVGRHTQWIGGHGRRKE